MSAFGVISLAIALGDILIAGSIAFYTYRLGHRITVLAASLAAFFVLRAAARLVGVVVGYQHMFDIVVDLLLLAVLPLLFVRAKDLATGLARARSEADVRRTEYERALKHYSQVVRHRIANPLTVIRGAAQTLDANPPDPATRKALIQAIIESSQVLEQVSLNPRREGPEEYDLDATPHVVPE